jgi:hypothetical protein
MSIISKTNRDGIDTVIEQLQQSFYPRLLGYWSTSAAYQSFPRANKNYREDQILPEISLDQKEYNEVLFNDKFSVTSFFLVADERPFQDEFKRINHGVSLIFQADLVALYGQSERMDEKFNMDVLRVLKKENFYIHDDILIIQGIDNVYRDLTLNDEFKKQINVTDISHMHVVRFDFQVVYKPNCNEILPPVCAGVSISLDGVFDHVEPNGGVYNCITGGGSFTYDTFINGQSVGQIVFDGTDQTVNIFISNNTP